MHVLLSGISFLCYVDERQTLKKIDIKDKKVSYYNLAVIGPAAAVTWGVFFIEEMARIYFDAYY